MNVREIRVTHSAVVDFDPIDFSGGWSRDPNQQKKAHSLRARWEPDADGWNPYSVTAYFRRVKKDGSLFRDAQDTTVYGAAREQFAEYIEATRPRYVAVLEPMDSDNG